MQKHGLIDPLLDSFVFLFKLPNLVMQFLILLLLRILLRLLILHSPHQLENQILLLLQRSLQSLLLLSILLDRSLYIIIVQLLLVLSLFNLIRLKLLKLG